MVDLRRTTLLEPGAIITFRDGVWKVAGLTASHAHLIPFDASGQQPGSWMLTEVFADPGFAVKCDHAGVVPPATDPHLRPDLAIYDLLTEKQAAQVQRKVDIALLARDGRIPGQAPDPELADLNRTQRSQILASRHGVSDRVVRKWVKRLSEAGIAGLVDRRLLDEATPYTVIDPRWREAFRVVLDRQPRKSRVTNEYLVEQVRTEAQTLFRADPPPPVSHRQMLRYLKVLSAGRGLHLSKKTQQSATVRDTRSGWNPVVATRAGHIVAIDSNRFDVFALDGISGEWQQVHMLLAIDIYTRSIVGWRFCGRVPNAQDVTLLLRHVVSPKFADPEWPDEGHWRYAGVPDSVVAGLLETDPLLERDADTENETDNEGLPVAGVPVIVPDQLSLDNGMDYKSADVRNACDLLGITLAFGRPYRPTDKAHIERVFQTINTGFLQRLPGYKGRDVFSRGHASEVEEAAYYTLDELEERFAAWVAVVYQNTPHSGLAHPALPTVPLTPNQMMDLSIAHSGYVPVPIDRDLQIELLPTRWLSVSTSGISVNNLQYDVRGTSFLDDYRNKPSPFTDQKNKWRVKVDRRDLRRVYFFAYDDPNNPDLATGTWEPVPLRDIPDDVPFQERHLCAAKRQLVRNGGNGRDQQQVAAELRNLLHRIGHYSTDALSREEKRLAAQDRDVRTTASPRRKRKAAASAELDAQAVTDLFDSDMSDDAEPFEVDIDDDFDSAADADQEQAS